MDRTRGVIISQDPMSPTANMSWASADPVPVWLDQARELSERWIHRQQILQALGRPSDLREDLAEPALEFLRWAYPFDSNQFGDARATPISSRSSVKPGRSSARQNSSAADLCGLVGPLRNTAGDAFEQATEMQRQQDLQCNVLGEPRKLGDLAQRVGQAWAPSPIQVGSVLGKRT
jgi:hypothetical protein